MENWRVEIEKFEDLIDRVFGNRMEIVLDDVGDTYRTAMEGLQRGMFVDPREMVAGVASYIGFLLETPTGIGRVEMVGTVSAVAVCEHPFLGTADSVDPLPGLDVFSAIDQALSDPDDERAYIGTPEVILGLALVINDIARNVSESSGDHAGMAVLGMAMEAICVASYARMP